MMLEALRLRRACVLGVLVATASMVPALAYAQPESEPAPEAPAAPPTPPPPTTAQPEASPPQPALETELEGEAETKAKVETKPKEGDDRRIKDHVFIFPAFVTSSIVASYVGVRVRVGSSTIENVPSTVGPLRITAVTLAETLDAGIKLTDWLGIFATGGMRSLISTNLQGLVLEGATYDFGAGGGVILRLFRSDKTGSQLSLRGGVGYTSGHIATLYPLFDVPIQSLDDLLRRNLGDTITTPFSTFGYGGSLAFAQSFGRLLGLQLSADIGGARFTHEPFDAVRRMRESTTVDGFTFALGAAPSIDFNAVHFPIAVVPEYVITRAASSAQIRGAGDFDTFHQLGVGAYYSGRTSLQLGVIWATLLGVRPLETARGQSDTPTQHFGQLSLRYVW